MAQLSAANHGDTVVSAILDFAEREEQKWSPLGMKEKTALVQALVQALLEKGFSPQSLHNNLGIYVEQALLLYRVAEIMGTAWVRAMFTTLAEMPVANNYQH